MPGIRVVTDSACDLTPEMADERNVRVVPLTIRFGDEELVDRTELSTKEFWDRVVTGPHMPETAAPSPGAFQQAFLDAAAAGADGVLCVNLSSRLSATFQSARTAAEAVAGTVPVRVVDSQSVTMGLGLMVISASERAAAGEGLDELVAHVEDLVTRTHVYGVVDSLDFLKRGGRIGGAQALLGSLLSIKPVIQVRDGVVEPESKQRTRTRALEYLAAKALHAGRLERLALCAGVAPDADLLATRLAAADCATELVVSDLGPVIGAHAGPGTIGMCFQVAR
ncbi:MAG TPA: DegV family protein [Acidimicrobiales bacterium]|nr:DegV family protein [Acidimicrobiales bacterium]